MMSLSSSTLLSKDSEICLDFALQHWCIWQAREIARPKYWPGGELLPFNGGDADVDFLPMMQRRRLSPLARATCAVAWRCRTAGGDMPTVFYSRHGESRYYFEMLDGMARGENVSPSRFSLCVHNAIGGLFSLQSVSLQPYVVLAGGSEGMFAAFLEAAGMLLEIPKLLLVCYEQPLPQAYQAYVSSPDKTWAFGMVLARTTEPGYPFRLARKSDSSRSLEEVDESKMIEAILSDTRKGVFRKQQSVWFWSLEDA